MKLTECYEKQTCPDCGALPPAWGVSPYYNPNPGFYVYAPYTPCNTCNPGGSQPKRGYVIVKTWVFDDELTEMIRGLAKLGRLVS